MGNREMPETEWQERLRRLEEQTLVNSALMNRLEQQGQGHKEWLEAHNAAIRKHDEEIEQLRTGLIKLTSSVQKTNDAVQIMEAGMDGLFERWDRFIREQEGNGQKQ